MLLNLTNNINNNKLEYLCRITLQYYGTVINGVLLTKRYRYKN